MASQQRQPYLKYAVSLLFVWSVLGATTWLCKGYIAEHLLSAYQSVFESITDDYKPVYFRIETNGVEPLFKIGVLYVGENNFSGKSIPKDIKMSSEVPVAYALQPMILAWAFIMIWPLSSLFQRINSLIISLPILFTLMMLDVPVVLLGSLNDLLLTNIHRSGIVDSSCVQIMSFLNGGGRLAMGILAAGITLLISNAIQRITARRWHLNGAGDI